MKLGRGGWGLKAGHALFCAAKSAETAHVPLSGLTRPDKVRGSDFVRAEGADGWPVYFAEPRWRVMEAADWKELGLPPRPAVSYE